MEQEPSFRERLAALHEKGQREGGKSVGELLSEAQEGFMYSGDFFRAMEVVDTLGIAYLRNILGYPFPRATREWYAKSWAVQTEFLKTMAPGDEVAENALETIQTFSENNLLRLTLQTVIDEIGRPSRRIYSWSQFRGFLQDLKIQSLALEDLKPPSWRKAFMLKQGGQEYWYTSASSIKARLAWPFVVRALGRVKRYAEVEEKVIPRIQPLLDQATLEGDPEQQSLHKLLTFPRQVGSLVIYDAHFRGPKKKGQEQEEEGLLAVLIGRMKPKLIRLAVLGWVADRSLSLPQEEIYDLPPLIVYTRLDNESEVGFERVQLSTKEELGSVIRIQHLIRRRLGLEGRFRIPALQGESQPPQSGPRKKKSAKTK